MHHEVGMSQEGMARKVSAAAFTLLELMIVVAIVAVLATVAVISYAQHLKKARILDAQVFISTIQSRQETYFQQFGTYCNASDTAYYPPLLASGEPVAKAWNPGTTGNWIALGARPEKGSTYFEFRVTASAAPHTVSSGTIEGSFQIPSGRPWYYAVGRANLDGTGTCGDPPTGTNCTMLWTTSARSDVILLNEGR